VYTGSGDSSNVKLGKLHAGGRGRSKGQAQKNFFGKSDKGNGYRKLPGSNVHGSSSGSPSKLGGDVSSWKEHTSRRPDGNSSPRTIRSPSNDYDIQEDDLLRFIHAKNITLSPVMRVDREKHNSAMSGKDSKTIQGQQIMMSF
jgi:hypothetical protein